MADPIRVAVVGASGRMGREVLKAVAEDEGMQLVAAVDHSDVGTQLVDLLPNIPMPMAW